MRKDDCSDCPLSSVELQNKLIESLDKINDIHKAVYGLHNQPELGLVCRVVKLEATAEQSQKSRMLQLGFTAGAAIGGGSFGALITKLLS